MSMLRHMKVDNIVAFALRQYNVDVARFDINRVMKK